MQVQCVCAKWKYENKSRRCFTLLYSCTSCNFYQTANSLWQKNVDLTKEWGNLFLNILKEKKDLAINAFSKGAIFLKWGLNKILVKRNLILICKTS